MMKVTLRNSLIMTVCVIVLGACQPAEEQTREVAADAEMQAEPTASIFGPEAGVPEPEAQADADPAMSPLEVTIGFPDGGAELDADAVAALESALEAQPIKGSGAIILRAHSDADGSFKANLDASEKRGLAVAAWLIERGISEDRIEVIAFGAQNPVQPNALPDGSPNEVGRGANRRVEVVAIVADSASISPVSADGKAPEAK